MNTREIGEALDRLEADVRREAQHLVAQYRQRGNVGTLKQAVDSPRRARAKIQLWISTHNAENGAGAAQTLLAQCLTAAGSTKTLATIDQSLAQLEAQAQTLINRSRTEQWSWEQVAAAVESALAASKLIDFSYRQLPLPADYMTAWGEPG